MNKPKSIRVAILTALSDGGIIRTVQAALKELAHA